MAACMPETQGCNVPPREHALIGRKSAHLLESGVVEE